MDDYDKANPPMTSNQQEDFADRVSDEYIDFVAESVSTDTNPPSMVATNKRITCREELETFIKNKEADLASIGDDAQMANVDLQNTLQKQQQIMTTMTNISKLLHDTALAVIRKIG